MPGVAALSGREKFQGNPRLETLLGGWLPVTLGPSCPDGTVVIGGSQLLQNPGLLASNLSLL